MRIECLVGLEQWDQVQDRLTKMIRSMPDQWCYIQQYINCQIKMCQRKQREWGVTAATREEERGGGSDGSTSKSGERGVACEDKSWNDLK